MQRCSACASRYSPASGSSSPPSWGSPLGTRSTTAPTWTRGSWPHTGPLRAGDPACGAGGRSWSVCGRVQLQGETGEGRVPLQGRLRRRCAGPAAAEQGAQVHHPRNAPAAAHGRIVAAAALQLVGINAVVNFGPAIIASFGVPPMPGNVALKGWNWLTSLATIGFARSISANGSCSGPSRRAACASSCAASQCSQESPTTRKQRTALPSRGFYRSSPFTSFGSGRTFTLRCSISSR